MYFNIVWTNVSDVSKTYRINSSIRIMLVQEKAAKML